MFGFRNSENNILARLPLDTKGRLYVSPMPYGPYDPHNRLMKLYRKHRIQTAIVLVIDEELKRKSKRDLLKAYRKAEIDVIRYPMPDLTCPNYAGIAGLLKKAGQRLDHDNMVIHCNAGVGRTAVVAGCLLRHLRGCSSEKAIATIKDCMLIKITSEQTRFIQNFPTREIGSLEV